MTGDEFRIWREGAGHTQAKAAIMAGISRLTVVRAEAAVGKEVPSKMARLVPVPELVVDEVPLQSGAGAIEVQDGPAPGFKVIKTPAEAAAAVKSKDGAISKELKEAMLRNPPFAKTAAEAKAMRHLRAEQKKVSVSTIRLLPLRPDWVTLEPSRRRVNAAIPKPVDRAAPSWAGPRGVLTESGEVYDYETAHLMQAPFEYGAPQITAGDW